MPRPDLTPYRRPLLFGGSFDPPHLAHRHLPQFVAHALAADAVFYLPAGRAPHKLGQRQTDPRHRLAMLRLALAAPGSDPDAYLGHPHPALPPLPSPPVPALILTDEIDRADDGRPSYTVDTLEALAPRLAPDARVRLLIGMDQLDLFESWHRWPRVLELAEPVVMRRPPPEPPETPETPEPLETSKAPQTPPTAESSDNLSTPLPPPPAVDRLLSEAWRARIVDVPTTPISSTDIRRRVAAGLPLDHLVAPSVADYIRQHRLYREAPHAP